MYTLEPFINKSRHGKRYTRKIIAKGMSSYGWTGGCIGLDGSDRATLTLHGTPTKDGTTETFTVEIPRAVLQDMVTHYNKHQTEGNKIR